jgi:hypothetical protein
MANTEKSLKAEKIIEKLINMSNRIEVEDMDAMGNDILVKITFKYDTETSIDEIDEEFIDKHNSVHAHGPYGNLNRIKSGVKFYGTVKVRVVKIVQNWFDEDEIEQVDTNINPMKDDINWSVDSGIYDHLLTRLYKFLPDSLYDIDVALTFNKNGV